MHTKDNYRWLDLFRLPAALLVIAIHTSPLGAFSPEGDFFLTRVLARIAVPFFFMVTGQFVAGKFIAVNREPGNAAPRTAGGQRGEQMSLRTADGHCREQMSLRAAGRQRGEQMSLRAAGGHHREQMSLRAAGGHHREQMSPKTAAGYSAGGNERQDGQRCLMRYIRKIFIIYVIAVMVYMPIGLYAGHYQELTLMSFLRLFFFDGTFYHLWYFPACLLGILLVYLMGRFLKLRGILAVSAVLYMMGLLGDSYFGLVQKLPLLETIYEFFFQICSHTRNGLFFAPLFMALGAWCAKGSRRGMSVHLTMLIVSFLLMTAEAFTLRRFSWQRHDSMYLMLVPVMISLYRVLLCLPEPCGTAGKHFRSASLWIYILHPAFIIIVRGGAKVLHLTPLLVDNSLVHYLAVSVLSAGTGFGIAFLAEHIRIFSGNGYHILYKTEEPASPSFPQAAPHGSPLETGKNRQNKSGEKTSETDIRNSLGLKTHEAGTDVRNGLALKTQRTGTDVRNGLELKTQETGTNVRNGLELKTLGTGTDIQNGLEFKARGTGTDIRNGLGLIIHGTGTDVRNGLALKAQEIDTDVRNGLELKTLETGTDMRNKVRLNLPETGRHRGHMLPARTGKPSRQPPSPCGRAWIELDSLALARNAAYLRSLMPEGCRLMPAVKANAYGHGAVWAAAELNRLGVDAFCVACLPEGIALRKAKIKGEILILGYTPPEDLRLLAHYRLTQTIVDYEYAEKLAGSDIMLHVHIGIDTGMHRLGIRCEDAEDILAVFEMRNLIIDGMFTHLCACNSSLPEDRAFTESQIQAFYRVAEILEEQGLPCPRLHLQSSYGLLNYPGLNADYVRAGIALYGVPGSAEDAVFFHDRSDRLSPVLSLKARVISVRALYAGEFAGYGLAFTAERDMRTAVLSIGYADGLPRELSCGRGYVLIHGCKAPVIGRICMDQTLVDISGISQVSAGDTAVLIGTSGKAEITAAELAFQCGTITNELLSRLGERLERVELYQKTF